MNLILFDREEIDSPLPTSDPRAVHILETLRLRTGDRFDSGVVDGPRGKARITSIERDVVRVELALDSDPTPFDPLELIVGLPRPQSARRILHDAAALGVRRIVFAATARSDPNYASSTLWASDEWRRRLIDGAQQAFDTKIPVVVKNQPLAAAIQSDGSRMRIALDNYEATNALHSLLRSQSLPPISVTLAFGPERGWDESDRAALRTAGFTLVSLGRRVMRVETAIASSVAVLRAELGWD